MQKQVEVRIDPAGQVRIWNDPSYTLFDTGTLDGFNGAVNCWILPRSCIISVFRRAAACGVARAIYNLFISHLGPASWFNNNNIPFHCSLHVSLQPYV